MSKCFMDGLTPCCNRLSREHYVSSTILNSLANGKSVMVGGLKWQKKGDTLESFGIESLQSRVLCETHNNGFSELDKEAGRLFRYILAVDKDPLSVPDECKLNGEKIQRWMLKTLIASVAANAMGGNDFQKKHKRILLGAAWPIRWGMYVSPPGDIQAFTVDLAIETFLNPSTREIVAASFRMAGVKFNFLLGSPDHADAWGVYRPRGLIFRNGPTEKRLEFSWDRNKKNNRAVSFTMVGKVPPGMFTPHLEMWTAKNNPPSG